MAHLISNGDSGVAQKIELTADSTLIGRHPDCEVLVDDTSVSRKHAQILCRDGDFWLEDLNSRNGTFLNDQSVHQSTRLYDGDVIKVCDIRFEFQLGKLANGQSARPTAERPASDSDEVFVLDDRIQTDVSSIMSRLDVSSHYESNARQSISADKRLEILMEITKALSRSVGLNAILSKVLDCLFEMFEHVDRGFIVLKEDDLLKPLAMKIRHDRDEERIRLSRTIVDHVMETQQAIVSADASADSRFNMSQSIADFRIRSILCAPLIDAEGQSIGIIQLDTLRHGVGFRDEDLEILITVAIQAGISIDNAFLHEKELKRREFQRDLELAHEVQHSMLPQRRMNVDGFEFYDYYRSANQVGGDYFDYIRLSHDKIAILVADVVGHGIAAALLMAKFSAEARFALAAADSIEKVVAQLNRALMQLQLDRFVTMAMAVVDTVTGETSIVNAGHMQPIVRFADGKVEQIDLEFSGMPLGIMDDADYPCYQMRLGQGDVVVFYTDGVSDAVDHSGNAFGIGRIVEEVHSTESNTAESIGKGIVRLVRQHMGQEDQPDDICLVTFGMEPSTPSDTVH